MTNITNDPFFMYAFYCQVLGLFLKLILIGYLLIFIAVILEIIAWVRFKDIKKLA